MRDRSVSALLALLCAALLPLLSAPLFLPTSGAAAAGAPAATDPDYPYLGYLRTTITGITPTVVTSSTGPSITVTGTMTNTSKGTIYDLRYVWQRGNALAGVTAIKAEIARPSDAAAVVDEESRILGPTGPPAATVTSGTTSSTTTSGTTAQVDLAPGASAPFVATITVGSDGLKISSRGVYALTVKVTGDIGQNGNTDYERVGEIHLLGTVLSVPLSAVPAAGTDPPATTGDRTTAGPAGSGTAVNPVSTTVLWPVVDTPHLGVDGVFLDDSLATSIARGGRLFGVLSALGGFTTGGAAVTLVVDPQLLDEVETMAGGYRVVATPGAAQAPLTPTSEPTTPSSATSAAGSGSAGASPGASVGATGTDNSAAGDPGATATSPSPTDTAAGSSRPGTSTSSSSAALLRFTGGISTPSTPAAGSTGASPTRSPMLAPNIPTSAAITTGTATPPPAGTVAGTGQAAAAAFLTGLRAATRTHQVLVLPYSDPDSVAMMRAGLDDQLAALITRGKAVATSVLQVQPSDPGLITDTLVPAGGAVNDATLAFLSAHGIAHAVLSPTTVRHAGGPVGRVTIDERDDNGALVTAALTDADMLSSLTDLVARARTTGLATRLGTVAALLTGGSLDGTGTPLVVLPDRRWTANAAGLSILSGLLQTLATGKVVAAGALPALTAKATTPATVAYAGAAKAAELPPGYLAQVLADTSSITTVRGSLVQARAPGSPDPAAVLDPLRTALASAAAAALRTDPSYGARILDTVGATLDGLRSGVSIVSQSPSSLAASTAPLLITVRNDLPYGVRVKVVVIDGESVGMTTKDPALEDIPEGSSHQFRIDASVVKAGRFQVHAQIQAADGTNWSAPTTITVSSSAYGALTIVLVAVAGGALTLMVALRLVQRVRNRNKPDGDRSGSITPAGTDLEPDSILAAVNESTARPGGGARGGGAADNRGAGDASLSPASPTAAAPFDEQGEPPR